MHSNYNSLTAAQRTELSTPALAAFIETCKRWKLTKTEELDVAGRPAGRSYIEWCLAAFDGQDFTLDEWQLLRLDAVSAIDKALSGLLPRVEDRITWLRKPSCGPLCQGKAPLHVLKHPEAVFVVDFRQAVEKWIETPFLRRHQLVRSSIGAPVDQAQAVSNLLNSLRL